MELNRAPQPIITTAITVSQTSPVPHNSLSGLQGGATDEFYHLTSAQYTGLGKSVIGLVEYANNAAALAGGLVAGDLYLPTSGDPRMLAVVV